MCIPGLHPVTAGRAAGTPRAPAPGKRARAPRYDENGKLQKIEYDRNKDGKVDTWGYMDGSRVVRVEVDDNGDGTVDRWEYHRAPAGDDTNGSRIAAGVDTTLERIERATRFDGRVSRWEHFTDGVLTKVEEDTDGNGTVDKWDTTRTAASPSWRSTRAAAALPIAGWCIGPTAHSIISRSTRPARAPSHAFSSNDRHRRRTRHPGPPLRGGDRAA
ncbi:MAG: hypothetical protein QM736_10115 [Vicinamibacterales bacterium]